MAAPEARGSQEHGRGLHRLTVPLGLAWLAAVSLIYYARLFERLWSELGGALGRMGVGIGG